MREETNEEVILMRQKVRCDRFILSSSTTGKGASESYRSDATGQASAGHVRKVS